ncbi:MAG: hypothetical protein AB8B85_07605 [Paracoccaceae bacterium]
MDASSDFAICGGYPPGQENYEVIKASEGTMADAHARIARVPLPRTDPVLRQEGPLLTAWNI